MLQLYHYFLINALQSGSVCIQTTSVGGFAQTGFNPLLIECAFGVGMINVDLMCIERQCEKKFIATLGTMPIMFDLFP